MHYIFKWLFCKSCKLLAKNWDDFANLDNGVVLHLPFFFNNLENFLIDLSKNMWTHLLGILFINISAILWHQIIVHCNPLQGSTGKYRENPVIKTGNLQWEQGFPVMKAGFSLWELTYREFPVSLRGFGFTVQQCLSLSVVQLKG